MGDAMVVDVVKKSMKRKRVDIVMSLEEREARIRALREEIDGLIKYYNERFIRNDFLMKLDSIKANSSSNSMIACLLEESHLPLSKLVESIFDQVKEKEGSITIASVKSSVLLVGQRSFYGVQNPNADVLEDESPSSLWCWETRDIKLLPKTFRGAVKIRRTCRKKIHERINAVSAVITELMKPESTSNNRQKVMKASEKLSKVLSEAEIRSLAEKMEQKNGADVSEKDVKREEKILEKNKREVEKEKLRIERELLKEKLQNEKEQKCLQDEAEKDDKRRENEMKKQLKRQQEEAEKEQKRREKEDAEQKKQLALQKQASILERFLKKSKTSPPSSQVDQSTVKLSVTEVSPEQRVHVSESVIQSMDKTLSLKEEFDVKELWKVHVDSWHQLSNCSNRKRHWGTRRTQKTVVIKELKLTSKGEDESIEEKIDDELTLLTQSTNSVTDSQKLSRRRKQLLQFDKSHRPAFYGYWPKKSEVVKARCPNVKDPELDYEIDSDEEWEEEEPGESLSDCDKEEEDENMEENISKSEDENESEDGFFVPDGYLSENEGVEVEKITENAKNLPTSTHTETEQLSILFRQLKHLNTLTEHSLRKNKPLTILNLMHEKSKSKSNSLSSQDRSESEQMCLQALCIHAFPVGPPIEILICDDMQEDVQEVSYSGTSASGNIITDSDLPEIVSTIQSCPHGINKVVETLRLKFPNITKSLLGNKVREISYFADNRWQVKKDILVKLGLSFSPEKTTRTKSIAAFFLKRCHPPAGKTTNPNQISPLSTEKVSPAVEMQNNTIQ